MLIGLHGAAGAGKDTAADRLCDSHGFQKMALADPIYGMVEAFLGTSVRDRPVKEGRVDWVGKSPRELLQLLGTEFGREILGHDVWIRHLMRRISWSEAADIVVTDVRFANEAAAIRARGGVVVEVVRPNALEAVSAQARTHSSEFGIPDDLIDVTIVNDGSVNDLLHRVDAAIADLLASTMK
jgi:hypothetical protein